ncbi:TPA: SGNH/GDSL hydrolase family protein [Stenotrophomonas maltophilia]|uniref:SGNH/GDSL hydrolase family protein n=1 Tax=Stenotrophomonas maltophilia TaxID=40324 RepID=UPI002ACC8B35|nr:GDSL-type esterase/lipase family protein [Stenotrophomonas maltophilia]MDZ5777645.1 GDSL-type esterase/lipase family protein [Stenotrophomonas maltophilia]
MNTILAAAALGLSALLPAPAFAADACLARVVSDLQAQWPNNATVNIVAFGHSVPAGYGLTPKVQKRDAYPRQLEDALADRFPYAVLNVITAGVGGENSAKGLARVQRDVVDHHPRVVLIDYALNDRSLPLAQSRQNLTTIIRAARAAGACPVLLTPTWDTDASPTAPGDKLGAQAAMIRSLGAAERVPVADSLQAFVSFKGDRKTLMAQSNHPNRAGHALVVRQLLLLLNLTP